MVLHDLAAIVGGDHARAGTDADAVAGRQPDYVVSPASTVETSEVLRLATAQGLRVVVRGAGTKLDWGAPAERVDLVLDTTRMDAVLEYVPGDLVLRCQAGA